MNNKIFCNPYCYALYPKEHKQTRNKEPHRCMRYDTILSHRQYHPNILKCEECLNKPIKAIKLISKEKAEKLYPHTELLTTGIIYSEDSTRLSKCICEPIFKYLGQEVPIEDLHMTKDGFIFVFMGFIIHPNMVEHYILRSIK